MAPGPSPPAQHVPCAAARTAEKISKKRVSSGRGTHGCMVPNCALALSIPGSSLGAHAPAAPRKALPAGIVGAAEGLQHGPGWGQARGALREERARGAAAGRNALRRLHRAIWTRRVEPPPAPSQTHPAGGLRQAARQRSGGPRAPCCRFRSLTRVRPDEWEALFHVGRAPRGAGMG